MELIFERGDHEIAASAAQAPEQVSVLGRACDQQGALSGDEVDRQEVVAGEAKLARQPAKTAAQCQAGNARIGDRASRGGQAECLGLAIEISPCGATFGAGCATHRVDADTAHASEIDHQSPLAYGVARSVVAAATYRHQNLVGACELHRHEHIGNPSATRNEGRASVDHPVPDLTGLVVAYVARTEKRTMQAGSQPLYSGLFDDRIDAFKSSNSQIGHPRLSSVWSGQHLASPGYPC